MSVESSSVQHNSDSPQISNQDLLSTIIAQAKIALTKADAFKEEYVSITFHFIYINITIIQIFWMKNIFYEENISVLNYNEDNFSQKW